MNMRSIVCLVCLCVSCTSRPDKEIRDADFDAAMGKESFEWQSMASHEGSMQRVELLRALYNEHRPSLVESSSEPKIPKCIHQIWIGPKNLPSYFWQYQKTWKEQHPTWEYRLWTDKEVAELDFDLKDLYLRSTNYGEKSDILRAELLDRFGGLYVDADFENVKPFDELHSKYDFFAGVEPPHEGDFTSASPHVVISDALIGARPHHPIIKKWKALIRERWDDLEKKYPDSPKRVLRRTFYPFGEAVIACGQDPQLSNIVFPPTYFYPLTFSQVTKGRLKKMNVIKRSVKSVTSLFSSKKAELFTELQPETMAIHYWGNSWLKSNEERLREMYRQVIALQLQVDELRGELHSLKAEK